MVINRLTSAVDDVTGQATQDSGGFRKTLRDGDFLDSDVSVEAGKFTKVGEFVVGAQEQYRYGFGTAKYEANEGYLYINIQNSTPELIDGQVRLEQRDAQERNIITVFEDETSVLNASKTDRTQQVPLPEQTEFPRVGRDSKLTISLNPDSADTVSQANTEMLIPVTVYPQ